MSDDVRWHGVTTTETSDFRLHNVHFEINTKTGEMTGSVEPQIRTDVWPDWLGIGQQQRDLARAARDANPGLGTDNTTFHLELKTEFRAAMQSVCAVAFAFEAFAGSVHHHVPASKSPGRSADARIHQTLARAFKLTNGQSKEIRSVLQKIFRFRDTAVHPAAAFADPAGHPHFLTGMEPRFVIFRVENAENCCTFAHNVFWLCLHRHRGSSEFAKWCEVMADRIGKPAEAPDSID